MKNIILEQIKEKGVHIMTWHDYTGEFNKLVLDNHTYNFIDFVGNTELTDEQLNILNCFSFTTQPTSNYHWVYHNNVMITLNQLNYGITLPDISDEGDLHDRLRDRVEIGEITNEEEKTKMLHVFSDILNNFFVVLESITEEELNQALKVYEY